MAWAFLDDRSRELLSASLGNQEFYSAWQGFLDAQSTGQRIFLYEHAKEAPKDV